MLSVSRLASSSSVFTCSGGSVEFGLTVALLLFGWELGVANILRDVPAFSTPSQLYSHGCEMTSWVTSLWVTNQCHACRSTPMGVSLAVFDEPLSARVGVEGVVSIHCG